MKNFISPILLFMSLLACSGTTVTDNEIGIDVTITDFGARTDSYNNAGSIQKAIVSGFRTPMNVPLSAKVDEQNCKNIQITK